MYDLLELTAQLVSVNSVSHNEAAIADLVASHLTRHQGLAVVRIGNNIVARTNRDLAKRLILAGHLDTVPPAGNDKALVSDDVLHGCGSADMKGGLAVLMDLAGSASEFAYDVTFVFYSCEEVAREQSGLAEIERADPSLLIGDVAILAEPTSCVVEAGCQGVVRMAVTVGGKRAHSARPWTGANAIHRLAPLLERVARFEQRRPVIDGCEYRESLQAVSAQGGIAGNVIPDACHVTLSHRFAPDRSADEATANLEAYLAPVLESEMGDSIVVAEVAPAALPNLSDPIFSTLLSSTGSPPAAKLGWTDVAFFTERNIPAVNFGPGDPLLAHRPDEHVSRVDLERAREVLEVLLKG